jgi:hypothetical protein
MAARDRDGAATHGIEMLASNPSMGFVKLIAPDATYDA